MNIMLHTSEVNLITSEVTVKDFLNVNEREITRNNKFVNVGCVKPIKDFPHYYISDQGKVYSTKSGKTRELRAGKIRTGYLMVGLYKDGKQIMKYVHRLVLETFNPIPDMQNYEVNHISEIKTDNRLCNLNWLTHKDNMNWGTRNERAARAIVKTIRDKKYAAKKVLQYDQNYNLIASYYSSREAGRVLGVSQTTISNYCHNLKLYKGKYYLQYGN